MISAEGTLILGVRAPWMLPQPRPRLEGDDGRRPDPEVASLLSVVADSFNAKLPEPYSHAAISMAIATTGEPHTVASMKLLTDAVVRAGLISDDRNEVVAMRILRYLPDEGTRPTVNVAVLESMSISSPYIRPISPVGQQEPRSPVVARAVAYAYTTGAPGDPLFSHATVLSPADYIDELRRQWNELLDRGAVQVNADWAASLTDGLALEVRMPPSGNFDPDNVVLRLLDLLEVARQESGSNDAADFTIDQALNEVSIRRDLDSGIELSIYPCAPFDQVAALAYFRDSIDDIEPKWPTRNRG